MNLLLMNTIATIAICATVVLVILVVFFMSFTKVKNDNAKKNINDDTIGRMDIEYTDLVLKEKYMFRKELKFLQVLSHILPKKYIAFPKIAVSNLLVPRGVVHKFDAVLSKTVDFVVFDFETMKPLLVVDIFDNFYGDETITVEAPQVSKAFKTVGLPVVTFEIKTNYDEADLRAKILEILEPNNHGDEPKKDEQPKQ